MIAFLKKVRVKTVFSLFDPVKVEPLELCYLKTVLDDLSVENFIIDDLFSLKQPKNLTPDILILTGYNVSEEEIIKEAKSYKSKYPKVVILVGGVHVQGNINIFHINEIDYVFHSQRMETFRKLIEKIINKEIGIMTAGVDSLIKSQRQNSYWYVGKKETIYCHENIIADRSLFNRNYNRLHYLDKRKVALIKGSTGCPYHCSYCYCKVLNNSQFVKADYVQMLNEMVNINADYFWIVDDVLFYNRNDALNFIEIVKKRNLNLKIIGYLRADFILRQQDLLISLKEIGLHEVIVGFEAVDNDELNGYEKTTNALDYPKIISILRENKIELTALFMVRPDYGFKEFNNLRRFIKVNKIEVFTISILTPVKGTKDYELLKKDLTTHNPRKFDFLHLVLKPKMPKWIFYIMFYSIHISLLKSKRIWRYFRNLITNQRRI